MKLKLYRVSGDEGYPEYHFKQSLGEVEFDFNAVLQNQNSDILWQINRIIEDMRHKVAPKEKYLLPAYKHIKFIRRYGDTIVYELVIKPPAPPSEFRTQHPNYKPPERLTETVHRYLIKP